MNLLLLLAFWPLAGAAEVTTEALPTRLSSMPFPCWDGWQVLAAREWRTWGGPGGVAEITELQGVEFGQVEQVG